MSFNTNKDTSSYIKEKQAKAAAFYSNTIELSDPLNRLRNRPRFLGDGSQRFVVEKGRALGVNLTQHLELSQTNRLYAIIRPTSVYPPVPTTSVPGSNVTPPVTPEVPVTPVTPANPYSLANLGGDDIFIAKYDSAQQIVWARRIGGASTDISYSIKTDTDGNVYVGGYYSSASLNFYNIDNSAVSFALTNTGITCGFVAKYNSSGAVQWVCNLGGINSQQVNALTVDSQGNVLAAGTFRSDKLLVANKTGTADLFSLANSGSTDIFLVKYNSEGVAQWARKIGGQGPDDCYTVATDSQNNVYLGIYVSGAWDYADSYYHIFNESETTPYFTFMITNGNRNSRSFLVKYSASGTPLWTSKLAGGASDYMTGITTDSADNLYLTGFYLSNPLTFWSADNQVANNYYTTQTGEFFLLKYTAAGARDWARRIVGTGTEQGYSVITDADENIYVTGYYSSSPLLIYDTDNTTQLFSLANAGSNDVFVVKYNSSGVPQWARRITTTGSDIGIDVTTDAAGNLYVSGIYSGTLTVYAADGSTSLFSITNAGNTDVFLAKYNSAGVAQWVRKLSSTAADSVSHMVTDSAGNTFLTGNYAGTFTIFNTDNTTTLFSLTTVGGNDVFTVKYDTNGLAQWVRKIGGTGSDVGMGVALDSAGNLYVIGSTTSGTLNVYGTDNTTVLFTMSLVGGTDCFLVKYNSAGLAQWIRRIGGTTTDVPTGIVVDSSDNVYVTGYYASATFNVYGTNNTTIVYTLSNAGSNDIFLIKYDSTGAPLWVRSIGGSGSETNGANSLKWDGTNIYVSGTYSSASLVVYDSTGVLANRVGNIENAFSTNCTFVLKYDVNGTPLSYIRTSGNSDTLVRGMTISTARNLYLTGYFSGMTYTSSDAFTALAPSLTLSGLGGYDAFIAKYNSAGKVLWVNRIVGTSDDVGYGIATDTENAVYIAGTFSSVPINVYASNTTSVLYSMPNTVAGTHIFIAKYDANGTAQWIRKIGGSGGNSVDYNSLRFVGNALYLSGYYNSSVLTVYNALGTYAARIADIQNTGSTNGFLLKYLTDGTLSAMYKMSGTGTIRVRSSDLQNENLYLVGSYTTNPTAIATSNVPVAPVSFLPTTTIATLGGTDMIVVKCNSSGTVQWVRKIAGLSNEIPYSIVTDTTGNVFVTGLVASATVLVFDADNVTEVFSLSNVGNTDGIVVKYDTNGVPLWAALLVTTGGDVAYSIVSDSLGNTYVSGVYAGALSIYDKNSTTVLFTLTNTGSNDVFVVKYDPSGTAQWVRKIASTGSDLSYQVAIDSSANLYVSGTYSGALTIFAANGSSTAFSLANLGSSDGFLVKYDTTGTPLWARRIAGTSAETVNAVAVDSNGDVYMTGIYSSATLNVYDTNNTSVLYTLTNSGSNDVFLVKYNSSGLAQWVRKLGAIGDDQAYSLTVDSTNNVYVTGTFNSQPIVVFATDNVTSQIILQNSGGSDVFLVKYNSSGTPQWARRIGGTGTESVSYDSIVCFGSTLYIVGTYSSSPLVVFSAQDTFASRLGNLANAGSSDSFILKYNLEGTALTTMRLGNTGNELLSAIALDSNENFYLTGTIGSSIPISISASDPLVITPSPTSTFTLTNSGSNDIFILKYNSSGVAQWARKISSSGSDVVYSMKSDSDGNVYVVGAQAGQTYVFDADATTPVLVLPNSGSNDGFLLKYDSSGTPQWIARIASSGDDQVYSIAIDSSNSIYISGYYSGALTVFSTNNVTSLFSLTNAGSNDVFLAKYNTSGVPLWARRLTSTGSDISYTVTTDTAGNVYVSGLYTGAFTVYNTDNSTTLFSLASIGSNDGFVVKYDSAGLATWARRIGGTGADIANGTSVDANGNVYVVGQSASGTVNVYAVNNTTVLFTLANLGSNDCFVVKYDSTGLAQWARRIGGTGSDVAFTSALDSDGNLYVSGLYNSTTLNVYAADNTTVLFSLSSPVNINYLFLVKYDTNGVAQWAEKVGGLASQSITFNSLKIFGSDLYLCGNFNGLALTVYSTSGIYSERQGDIQNTDMNQYGFVVKYNLSGVAQSTLLQGSASSSTSITAVDVDGTGNLYVGGLFTAAATFNATPQSLVKITALPNDSSSRSTNNMLVLKFNSSGTVEWRARIGANASNNAPSLTLDSQGNVIVNYVTSGSAYVYALDGLTPLFVSSGSIIIKYNSSGVAQWVRRMQGGNMDAFNIVCDSSDAIYTAGRYGSSGSMSAFAANGSTAALNLQGSGISDVYTSKHDANGTPLIMIRGGPRTYRATVAVDSAGNMYGGYHAFFGGGSFYTPATISSVNGGVTGVGSIGNPYANWIGFIAKYNSSGVFQWFRRIGVAADTFINAVALDADASLFVTGWYNARPAVFFAVDDVNVVFTLPNSGNDDVFLAKYSTNGVFQWARRVGGGNSEQGMNVVVDSAGNVYMTVQATASGFVSVYDSDGLTVLRTLTTQNWDTLVLKYNNTGTFQWVRLIGGTGFEAAYANGGLAVNSSNVVCVGGTWSTSTLRVFAADGTTAAFSLALSGSGVNNGFFVKYDADGTPLSATQYSVGNVGLRGIAMNAAGEVFATAQYFGAIPA